MDMENSLPTLIPVATSTISSSLSGLFTPIDVTVYHVSSSANHRATTESGAIEGEYAAALGMKLQKLADPFTPCFMFFYDSLMNHEGLKAVLKLQEDFTVVKGVIKDFP